MSQTFHENENNMATKNSLGRTPIMGYKKHKLYMSYSFFLQIAYQVTFGSSLNMILSLSKIVWFYITIIMTNIEIDLLLKSANIEQGI